MAFYWQSTAQNGAQGRRKVQSDRFDSVTSYEVGAKIAACSGDIDVVTPCLLEVNTFAESSKLGLSSAEWRLNFEKKLSLPSIAIVGLMTMAPLLAGAALKSGNVQHAAPLRSCAYFEMNSPACSASRCRISRCVLDRERLERKNYCQENVR